MPDFAENRSSQAAPPNTHATQAQGERLDQDASEVGESSPHAQMLAYARELRDLYRAARNRAARFRLLVEMGNDLAGAPGLDGLLRLALERAMTLSSHDGGSVLLLAGPEGPLEPRASVGADAGAQVSQLYRAVALQVLQERRPLTSPRAGDAGALSRPGLSEPRRSITCLPLATAAGRPIGVLALRGVGHDLHADLDEMEMLQLLAARLAAMIESAQLNERLQSSLGALLAIHEVGQILGSSLDMQQVGRQLLEIAGRVSGLEAGTISLLDQRQRLRVWQAVGPERLWRWSQRSSLARAARRSTLLTGNHCLYRMRQPPSQVAGLAAWCIPLRVLDRILGVVEVYGEEAAVGNAPVDVLATLAGQAATALENARLYRELADRERRLHDLVGRLLTAQEEERRHVAYELHDGLAQVAASAHQHLQAFARHHRPRSPAARVELDQALELAQKSVGEARRAIANLRPTALDNFGLEAAIRLQAESLRSEGWQITCEVSLGPERLPSAIETPLFRVLQEALANIRKHAQTTRSHIALRRRGEAVRLEIRDWGRGFRPGEVGAGAGPGERMGILGMQERIALLGGQCKVRSRPGAGTRVVAEVPLPGTER